MAERRALREGLLNGSLDDLAVLRLTGCRCSDCHEVSFGARDFCPSCGGQAVEDVPLAREGMLWSYTVVRHCPPGDYAGKDSFTPFGLGLVELPDGLRVNAPIDCPIEALEIGMALKLKAYCRPHADGERVLFAFEPA